MPTREQVWQAVYAKMQTISGFQSYSRRVRMWPDSTMQMPIEQPCLTLIQGDEETQHRGPNLPPIRTWTASIWIYAKIPEGFRIGEPDHETPGASVINPLIDAVETSFQTPDDIVQNTLTLGGLVAHCYISGTTAVVVGDLNADGQCWAGIPIHILVP